MNKIVKRLIIIVLCVCVLCGGVVGCLFLVKNSSKSAVNVYRVENFAMTDHSADTSYSSGLISADKLQNVYISDTQQIKEIFVTDGQYVKAGDPLVSYDTTLSDIALEKAENQVRKTELKLEEKKKELEWISCLVPHYSVLVTPEFHPSDTKPVQTPCLLGGTGTLEDPYCFLWGEDDLLSADFLSTIAPSDPVVTPTDPADPADPAETTEPTQPTDPDDQQPEKPQDPKTYAVFITREENRVDTRIQGYFGMMVGKVNGQICFRPYSAMIPEKFSQENIPQEPYYEEYGSAYTASEIAQMRAEKEREITDLDIQLKAEKVQLKQMQEEVNNGIITAKMEGVVRAVLDPEAARATNAPLLTVSGGGGYYISVYLSELEMSSVHIGQTVSVSDWYTGNIYEGTITEISNYPVGMEGYYGNGNPYATFYPFTVFVDDSAQLREGSYADVSYQVVEEETEGFYLSKMFVRSENNRSYVLVQGANGKLEKRYISTGKVLWNEYIFVRDGLALDEYIAFPYGQGVAAGTPARQAEIDEFYSNNW